MKIDSLEVNSFARDEYTANQTPKKSNLGGDSLLIKGPNKSGKSLTFAAIAHVVLGDESPLNVAVGRGNDVSIGFTDGSKMFRGAPRRQYEVMENDGDKQIEKLYAKKEADEKFRANMGTVSLVRNHFLPSEMHLLPLERHYGVDRLDVVRSAIDRPAKLELEQKKEELKSLRKSKSQTEDRLQPLKKDKSRRSKQVGQLESQKSDWETIVELSESGRLREIQEKLNREPEIREQLHKLSKRKVGLERKINSKENEIEALQRYKNNVEEIIAEAMTEFVCPVCDEKIDTVTAKRRMKHGNCPFCNEDRSADQVKQHIRKQKAEAEGRPGKLSVDVAEHKTELSKIQSKIENLEEKLPAVSELNSLAVNKLEMADSLEDLERMAGSKLKKVSEKLEEYKSDLNNINLEVERVTSDKEDIEDKESVVEDRIQKLKNESMENKFSEFQATLNNHFTQLGGELGEASAVRFDKENGDITLLSENSKPRKYKRRSELSGSEIQLLNISFVLSLNDHARASNALNWEVLIMDEPFSKLDDEITEHALEYLYELPQQIIMTTSTNDLNTWFSKRNTLQLSRSETIQADFSQYN